MYESFRDSLEWTSINDIPADMVWGKISGQNKADWEYFTDALKREIERHYFLIAGTCGRWNGLRACGNFITGCFASKAHPHRNSALYRRKAQNPSSFALSFNRRPLLGKKHTANICSFFKRLLRAYFDIRAETQHPSPQRCSRKSNKKYL